MNKKYYYFDYDYNYYFSSMEIRLQVAKKYIQLLNYVYNFDLFSDLLV